MLSDFVGVEFYSVVLILCDDCKVSNVNKSDKIDTAVCTSLPAMNRAIKLFSKENKTELCPTDTRKIYDYIKENQEQGKEARKAHKEDVKAYRQKVQTESDNRICPYCKKSLVLRHGQYGDFYGCSGYPKCKYTEKQNKRRRLFQLPLLFYKLSSILTINSYFSLSASPISRRTCSNVVWSEVYSVRLEVTFAILSSTHARPSFASARVK